MESEKWSFRIGVAALALAVVVRIGSNGVFGKAMERLRTPEVMRTMLFLETGRVVYPASSQVEKPPKEPLPEETVEEQPEALPVFAAEDAQLIKIKNVCGLETDVETMLQSPLSWTLQSREPTVLILHSHGSESYENTENYKASEYYRTLDSRYNMVSVGESLKQILEEAGISVIHDTTLHDYPSYNSSYTNSRSSVKAYLEAYPSIRLVLDLHRDAVRDSQGDQVAFTTTVQGEKVARLMMVVGTDVRLSHPNWPENMSLAVKLHALLEKEYPGICRPISFRNQRFNQDLSAGAMLIEVGSAGNTRQEALAAAEILGEAIIQLAKGTGSQESLG